MATIKSKYLADLQLTNEASITLYVALLTAMPTKNDGTGLVEVSTTGTGYARLPITTSQWAALTTLGDNVTEQALSNIGLTWTNSGATNMGTVVAIATYDAVTAGNLYRAVTLSTGSQVITSGGSGNVFNLPAGNVTRQEA